jgi:hypothetical protein
LDDGFGGARFEADADADDDDAAARLVDRALGRAVSEEDDGARRRCPSVSAASWAKEGAGAAAGRGGGAFSPTRVAETMRSALSMLRHRSESGRRVEAPKTWRKY